MKLYTEYQVRKAWNTAFTDALSLDEEDYKPKFFEDFLTSLTPIELPTDEEIEEPALKWFMTANKHEIIFDLGWMKIFEAGAKWMRDKIQGGNK